MNKSKENNNINDNKNENILKTRTKSFCEIKMNSDSDREVKKLTVVLKDKEKQLKQLERTLLLKDSKLEEYVLQEQRYKNIEKEFRKLISSQTTNDKKNLSDDLIKVKATLQSQNKEILFLKEENERLMNLTLQDANDKSNFNFFLFFFIFNNIIYFIINLFI